MQAGRADHARFGSRTAGGNIGQAVAIEIRQAADMVEQHLPFLEFLHAFLIRVLVDDGVFDTRQRAAFGILGDDVEQALGQVRHQPGKTADVAGGADAVEARVVQVQVTVAAVRIADFDAADAVERHAPGVVGEAHAGNPGVIALAVTQLVGEQQHFQQ